VNKPIKEHIDPDKLQNLMMFGVGKKVTLRIENIEKPWKVGELTAFKVLDFGYCLDLDYPSRSTIDSVKIPEPYKVYLRDDATLELDYRLKTFIELAPIGGYMEKMLRFKLKNDKVRDSKISDKLVLVNFSN
jgi:hypothetical protein